MDIIQNARQLRDNVKSGWKDATGHAKSAWGNFGAGAAALSGHIDKRGGKSGKAARGTRSFARALRPVLTGRLHNRPMSQLSRGQKFTQGAFAAVVNPGGFAISALAGKVTNIARHTERYHNWHRSSHPTNVNKDHDRALGENEEFDDKFDEAQAWQEQTDRDHGEALKRHSAESKRRQREIDRQLVMEHRARKQQERRDAWRRAAQDAQAKKGP